MGFKLNPSLFQAKIDFFFEQTELKWYRHTTEGETQRERRGASERENQTEKHFGRIFFYTTQLYFTKWIFYQWDIDTNRIGDVDTCTQNTIYSQKEEDLLCMIRSKGSDTVHTSDEAFRFIPFVARWLFHSLCIVCLLVVIAITVIITTTRKSIFFFVFLNVR